MASFTRTPTDTRTPTVTGTPTNTRTPTTTYTISQDSYDQQYCWILGASGQILAEPLRLSWPNSNAQNWTLVTYDLRPFLGQTVCVYFEVYNNGYGGITTLYLDDVSVETCP